jgi:3-dehydroquinate dehydratase-1
MDTMRIGTLELGRVPRVAAVLNDIEVRRDAMEARALADLFELRIDMFDPPDRRHALEVCRDARTKGVPLIATIRSAEEGGVAALADEQRLEIFEAVLPLVDAVDVEFRAAIRHELVSLAHAADKLAIVSLHDFQRTPIDGDLVAILDAAKLRGADVVKIATTVAGTHDLERLLGLLLEHRDKGLIVIGMGPHGAASRVLFPLLGSLVTYGFLHQAAAPGQLSLAELVRELERYVPDFAAERRRAPTA